MMRSAFDYPSSIQHWFPGHMTKGLRDMARKIQKCDCVLEVQDARIPLSGINRRFAQIVQGKPKVLLINKIDLIGKRNCRKIMHLFKSKGVSNVIPLNCKNQSGLRRVLPTVQEVLLEKGWDSESTVKLMVIGMPNVGKSSLINALRNLHYRRGGRATAVGALPGVTKSVLTPITVSEDPHMYSIDTPGIIQPFVDNPEVALKLALTGMLKDHLIGEDVIADYLLYTLNKKKLYKYLKVYNVPCPNDNTSEVLTFAAKRLNAKLAGGKWDYLRVAQNFILRYRSGELGSFVLDDLDAKS